MAGVVYCDETFERSLTSSFAVRSAKKKQVDGLITI